ncbi:uncharacterized protein LOC126568523 [Anopheles maculipalpis]|uniref:uncharacterized protein LOC126568523 n=1 Tax=Anopheles maculipalpis TaxID=1496333 RepID=UPI002158BC98|nr:uncharacterized protein LOC126568523 [Anopheles maculipalpis]
MKNLGAILLLKFVLVSFHFQASDAFVKLVLFGTKVEMKSNVKTFNISYTFHNPESLTNQSLDFNIYLLRKLNDLKMVMSYNVVALNGTVQNELLKRSIDVCFFFRNPRSDRLVKSVFDYIKARSHLPARCPIPPDYYNMCNLRLSDVPLPALLPETEFMVQLAYYSGLKQEIIASFKLYGKLVRIVENILPIIQ